ncbi:hypothetical protein Q1695_004536 [Nippostrongylus brasiliensis]|nr:hypothetical protein Q1695_004536 [Nippostrongylus brasiliensis]
MKRRKIEHDDVEDSNGKSGGRWASIKEAVMNQCSTSTCWKTDLLDYLRGQKDDPVAREEVLKSVDVRFLTTIMVSYTATTSAEDRALYDALDLLENTYKVNMSPICPVVWGEKSAEIYEKRAQFGGTLQRTAPEQVLGLLDGIRMWRTVMNHTRPTVNDDTAKSPIYDVRFLMRLFVSMIHPGSELKYRQFIEANGLALAFSCTSSKDVAVRKLAYCVLQKFLSLMQELNIESAEDKYKILYIYIIRLLKQSIESDAPRLPHVISHFFARLSKLILHPESPVFTAVLSFLILKPVMELDQVPELYKMLLSSSVEHHHQEREWILTLISESLIEPADYTIIQNRSGFKLMLSLFPTAMVDMTARRLILAILKTAVQMRSVAHDLFHRMNLHTWIACVIKDRSLSTWEQCYLAQIYCILIEMERKYCRQAQVGDDDTKRSSLVAATTVRLTSRQVLAVMKDMSEKQTAVENLKAIEETLKSKWHPKKKKSTV